MERFIKELTKVLSIISFIISPISALIMLIINLFLLIKGWILGKNTRLNMHFSYSIKAGKYYLHHTPYFLYTWISYNKFLIKREDAIERFIQKYPNESLYSQTMTLQDLYHKKGLTGYPITTKKYNIILISYFCILTNLRNFYKLKVIRLFTKVDNAVPLEYKLF